MDTPVVEGLAIGGRYRLGRRLGAGGMAEVYEAIDERLVRPVAVKLLRPEFAANPALRRRFEAEARAAARLAHPNVVAVYDTGEDDGRAFIVMELVAGSSLAEHLAAGPLDQRWLRGVAGDVLGALAAAHHAGILHRDIKPGNILIGPNHQAKVADFGIAKTVETIDHQTTATGLVIGTPDYLSPERLEGRPASPQSDLYAVGVVLYEALTGSAPFPSNGALAAAAVGRSHPPPDPRTVRPDADPGLVVVIRRALAPDPGDRYPNAESMAAALAAERADAAGANGAGADAGGRPPAVLSNGSPAALPTVVQPAVPVGGQPTLVQPGLALRWDGSRTAELRAAPGRFSSGRPSPAGRRRRGSRVGWTAFGVALVTALAVVAALALQSAGRGSATPRKGATTTLPPTTATTAPTTTTIAVPIDAAGDQLRQLAAGLTGADGARGPALAALLTSVAGAPNGSTDRASRATQVLSLATQWYDRGHLSASAYQQAATALLAAGGQMPAPPPTTTKHGNGNGNNGGND